MTAVQPLNFQEPEHEEELARANLYGVLASLFYGPPSQALLNSIANAPAEGDGLLQREWNDLASACRLVDTSLVREEYETLFIGVGKPEVMLYGSYYLSGFLMEKPLAALRSELDALGLQRDERMPESEDHIAALCEVMRYLILSGDAASTGIERQKRFFSEQMQPWVNTMCNTIASHPEARFYRPVAQLARTFFEVEAQAFDMVN